MTPQPDEIYQAARKLFFAGRNSMQIEIESKGRALQLPIDEHTESLMQSIGIKIREARQEQIMQDEFSLLDYSIVDESKIIKWRNSQLNKLSKPIDGDTK